MALIGNRSVLNKSPGRWLAGTVASGDRSAFSKPGMVRGSFERFSKLSAFPYGHLSPSAWVMPQKAGGMSSRNAAELGINATASGAMGLNSSGASAISVFASATAQLIASAIGSATFAVTAFGSSLATLNGAGSAVFMLTTSGTIGALAWGEGAAGVTVSATLTSYARGMMVGSTVDGGQLTTSSIAASVWAAQSAGNNDAGSMGAKLNSAASGGVDLNALATAVWGYTQ